MNLFGGKKKVVEADKIPTTVEQAIPIQEIYEDGICLVGRNLWSKTFRFTDINYEVASREDKEKMFLGYSEILNSFDSGATTKITVSNRRILRSNFEKNNMLREMGDSLDGLRYEYNMILERNVNLSTGVSQEKYMTVTVEKQTLEEARQYFNRICAEFTALFSTLGSVFEEVRAEDKLRIFFDFFHHGEEEDFCYDRSLTEKRGHSFKDAIAPQSMEFRSDHFKIEGRYGRVLYLKDYANFIKDSFIAELTGIDRHLMLSIDADPIPIETAIRQGENKLLSVETNISNWQRKQNQNNNFSAAIPYDMERQRTESREFLNDLVARDQRMIHALITIVHTADTKEALDADTERIRSCARKHLCGLTILRWQQLEGLNSCLPYGCRKLGIRRTLTTESLAVFMPFRVQEICHSKGIYLGNNAISKNPIIVNRQQIEQYFHMKVYDMYGCQETNGIAYECSKGHMHVMSNNVYLEILDNHNNICQNGECGNICVTGLHNTLMPMIRYKLNDIGRILNIQCECGNADPIIELKSCRFPEIMFFDDNTIFDEGILVYPLRRFSYMDIENDVLFSLHFVTPGKYKIAFRNLREEQLNEYKILFLKIMKAYQLDNLDFEFEIEQEIINTYRVGMIRRQ